MILMFGILKELYLIIYNNIIKQFNGKKLFLIFNSYDECLKIKANDSTVWNNKGYAFYNLE